MSSRRSISQKVSVDEQPDEQDIVDEGPEFRASVALERQAKIDSDVRERIAAGAETDRPRGMTLVEQETWAAREAEIAGTRERADGREIPYREAGSRVMAAAGSRKRRVAFAERAASVTPEAAPERADPREELARETLAAVNQQAERIHRDVECAASRAVIARRIAERVSDGRDVMSAAVAVLEAVKTQPGSVVPLGMLADAEHTSVIVEGEVVELWDAASPVIAQVGLLADETGRTKVTIWEKSRQPRVAEGESVRIRDAERNWYQGRCNLAVTSRSTITFLGES